MKRLILALVLAMAVSFGYGVAQPQPVKADSTVAILDAAGHVVGTTYGEIAPDWCYNGANDFSMDNDGHVTWLQCNEGTQYVRQ